MKKCSGCQELKNETDFGSNRAKADGLQTHCRECKRALQNRWYAKNKNTHIENVSKWRKTRVASNWLRLQEYFRLHPCIECGEQDWVVLEFDHVTGEKRAEVSYLIGNGYSWATIQAEIEKCVVRCVKCHRRKTAKQFGYSKFRLTPP